MRSTKKLKKALKLLFILPEYYPHSGGGISTYYQHYIEALKPYCDVIKVIVGSGYVQCTDKFEHNGIEVEYLDPSIYKQHLINFSRFDLLPEYRNNMAAAWAMWEQAGGGNGFDIIECTDFGLGFVPWVIHHNKPVVTRLHGSAGQISLYENNHDAGLLINANIHTELALLSLSDILLTHSKTNRAFWLSVFPQANLKFITPVYTTAITHKPLPLAKRNKEGLVTARVQKWKGPEILCRAMQLLKTNVNVTWLGRDTSFTKGLSTGVYLKNNYPDVWGKQISHNYPIINNEVLALQQKAAFGIVPSVWDMFNFSALEFMAAGTPLICSDGAGASELIEHGVNGFKIPSDDPVELAKCIELLLSLNQADYQKMGIAGQQTIINELSGAKLMPVYREIYNTIRGKFSPTKSNQLLNKLYAPSGPDNSLADILDKQPLKLIVPYLKKRLLKKIKRK
jgi:glycosyltransferase involved in cell wall biosynthesis